MDATTRKINLWTANPENIETVKRMWQGGFSASKIAQAVGGISRNAILGFVHRNKSNLGLCSRVVTTSQSHAVRRSGFGKKKKKPEKQKRARVASRSHMVEIRNYLHKHPGDLRYPYDGYRSPTAKSFEEMAKGKTCKWPIGEGRNLHFCGASQVAGSPYCPDHYARAYTRIPATNEVIK